MRHKEYAASDDPRVKRKRADREVLQRETADRADSDSAQRAKDRDAARMDEYVRGIEQDKAIDAMSLELTQKHARLNHSNETPPLDHRQQQPLKGIEA